MLIKSRFGASVASILAAAALVLTVAAPAQATTTPITGDVNCNGNNVYYSTIRYVSANSTRIQFTLTNASGSDGVDGTGIGAHLTASNTYLGQKWTYIQAPSAVLSTYYLQGTAFNLYAHMEASVGPCDNHFGGNLYY